MRAAFEWLGLNWITFRFMLQWTGSVMGGYFVYHLARADFTRLRKVPTIEIYVVESKGADLVSQFFKTATAFKQVNARAIAYMYLRRHAGSL